MSVKISSFGFGSNCILAIILIGLSGSKPATVSSASDSLRIISIQKRISATKADPGRLAILYKNLGKSYEGLYGFNRYSLDAYQKSASYFAQTGDSSHFYDMKMDIGLMYYFDNYTKKYALEQYESALKYYNRTAQHQKRIHCQLSIIDVKKSRQSADQRLIQSLLSIEKDCIRHHFPHELGYARNLLASCYFVLGKYSLVKKYTTLSQQYSRKAKVDWMTSLNFYYLALVQDTLHHQMQAIDLYQQAYALSGKEKNVTYARQITLRISQCYQQVGDYKRASEFYKKTLAYTSQYYESEQTKTIRLEELNHQNESLVIQKQLAEEQNTRIRSQNLFFLALLILLVLTVVTLVYLRTQQRIISRQKEFIQDQKIRNLELRSLQALIQGQENERSRIARDLHDGLGVQLSQIKFFVEALPDHFTSQQRQSLNLIIDEACQEIRDISHDLHPASLSKFGLVTAIEDLVHKLQIVNNTSITFSKYGSLPELKTEAVALLYRAIQELINNALKHAFAQNITIQLIANQESLFINVEDDGIGFDTPVERHGSGITNVSSRISYLSGQALWQKHSLPDSGTSVMISIPIVKISI